METSPSLKPPSLSCTARQTKLSTFLAPRPVEEVISQRSIEVTDPSPTAKGVKRKVSGGHRPAAKSHKTNVATLKTFFNSSSPNTCLSNDPSTSCQPGSDVTTKQLEPEEMESRSDLPTSASSQLSTEWLSVFSGPPKPPLCKGHNESAILRTVRKSGPNRGRQFWVCPRPAGSKNDSTTKCDFFQWLTRGSKSKVT